MSDYFDLGTYSRPVTTTSETTQLRHMSKQVSWQVELVVKPGELDNFRALTREMVASTRNEPGALDFERFVSADGKLVHVYERYVDSASAVAHLRTFQATFSERFSAMVDRQQFTVYGAPSAELRRILDGIGVRYLGPFDGFYNQRVVRLNSA